MHARISLHGNVLATFNFERELLEKYSARTVVLDTTGNKTLDLVSE